MYYLPMSPSLLWWLYITLHISWGTCLLSNWSRHLPYITLRLTLKPHKFHGIIKFSKINSQNQARQLRVKQLEEDKENLEKQVCLQIKVEYFVEMCRHHWELVERNSGNWCTSLLHSQSLSFPSGIWPQVDDSDGGKETERKTGATWSLHFKL